MKVVIIIFLALIVSGCVTDKRYEAYLQTKSVDQRVTERLTALVAKKYAVSYQYFLKSYRDMVSLTEYIQSINSRIIWKDFKIMKTDCTENICKVNIKESYRIPPMFGFPLGSDVTEYIEETWIQYDGEWFYLPPK